MYAGLDLLGLHHTPVDSLAVPQQLDRVSVRPQSHAEAGVAKLLLSDAPPVCVDDRHSVGRDARVGHLADVEGLDQTGSRRGSSADLDVTRNNRVARSQPHGRREASRTHREQRRDEERTANIASYTSSTPPDDAPATSVLHARELTWMPPGPHRRLSSPRRSTALSPGPHRGRRWCSQAVARPRSVPTPASSRERTPHRRRAVPSRPATRSANLSSVALAALTCLTFGLRVR